MNMEQLYLYETFDKYKFFTSMIILSAFVGKPFTGTDDSSPVCYSGSLGSILGQFMYDLLLKTLGQDFSPKYLTYCFYRMTLTFLLSHLFTL